MPEVLMPRLSDTMEEGTLSRWLTHEGAPVRKGDAIAEIETDKAVMELEAYDEGPLTRILVAEGTTVPIGTPLAVIGTEPQAAPDEAAPEQARQTAADAPAPPAGPTEGPARTVPAGEPPASERGDEYEVRTSPLARALARQHGIDITTVTGSGPGGRIVRADVDDAITRHGGQPGAIRPPTAPEPAQPAGPAAAHPTPAEEAEDVEEVPLSTIRRLTAQRLTQSMQQAPHFYLTTVIDVEPLLAFRADINAQLGEPGLRISVTDLLVKACATALRTHPQANSSWDSTRILRHRRIHIGIAVALDDGLTVPVVHDADRKTLTQIAREAHALADNAHAGRLALEDLSGGTFTISNLGTYGVDHFTAVINPPQAAILAVGAAQTQPVIRDGELAVGTTMALTLSIDHRVLDGATAAAFLADLKTLLEHPLGIVL
ncbi:2-oxo acid dehydrogenase subunit E2 (plasmid) [Streptomyces sp. NBC_01450]|uniref:dihydrolipoamide acetyltransferase family protein n=1 Tax=Streptomyces sp. NBC_01450 TaxID=2903871 RepID=UPI002E36BD82|nr:dihydrolipoamide acetyltransferase family protein [Streptomyces sp. NBC_01450]